MISVLKMQQNDTKCAVLITDVFYIVNLTFVLHNNSVIASINECLSIYRWP